ncbi:MAG: site-2 protease family protein [Clostridia bacterium]|nr:site-2 protease family protein [Clostridia bacterium]
MYIILAILLFGLLIFIHELGHYITARIFNVAITEFSIGMGPKLISKTSKKTGIAYSIRALPIGGFVSMVGEDEESDNENAFHKKPIWQRLIVCAAGSVSNVLLGFVVMFILVISTPQIGTVQVASFPEGATSSALIKVDDIIKEVDGHNVHTLGELNYFINRYGSEPVQITVQRAGNEITLENVVFPTTVQSGHIFGLRDFYVHVAEKNFPTILKNGFFQATLTIRTVFDSIWDLITGTYGVEDLSGPVGVVNVISTTAKTDAYQLWSIFVLLAMNLGIMNLLPIPALDGGRMLMLLIEAIIKRPVNKTVEGYINLIGMILLFGLMIFITVKDVFQIIL